MTPDEAKAVLAAAAVSAQSLQWDDVINLLRNVHDQSLLEGSDQGDAAYLLGLAYLDTGSFDGAHYYFTEASTTAGAQHRADAQGRLEELARYDQAVDDEGDGVQQGEAALVLRAGDDATARQDYDEAMTHYRAVYDGTADDGLRAKGALGIATVLAHQGDLEQSAQYAEYVIGTGSASAAEAQSLLTWIHEQQAADVATEDGTTVDEYAATWEAGKQAYFHQDYEQARMLFLSVWEAPQLGMVERAKAAYNAGQAERLLGLNTEAREHLEWAGQNGNAETATRAGGAIALLDAHDVAEALADDLAEELDAS